MLNRQNIYTKLKKILTNWFGFIKTKPRNKQELLTVLKHAKLDDLLEDNAYAMIEGVLTVRQTRAKDVMISRSKIVSIDKDLPLKEIIPIVVGSGYSRFPVMSENKDEVLGIILAKDLLPYAFNNQLTFEVSGLLRNALFIPENKRLDILLQDFRTHHQHMAIIIDEYGGVTGIITIEDIIEQIVGDIEDEYDYEDGIYIKKQAKNVYLVNALTTLVEFNEYFHSEFFADEVETIGGYIMRKLGRIPKNAEKFDEGHFSFNIMRADTKRINLLKLEIKG